MYGTFEKTIVWIVVSLPVKMHRNWQRVFFELQSERNYFYINKNGPWDLLRNYTQLMPRSLITQFLNETEGQNKKIATKAIKKGGRKEEQLIRVGEKTG